MKDLIKVSFPPIELIIFLMCEDYGCVSNHYLTFGRKWWIMGGWWSLVFNCLIIAIEFHWFNLLDICHTTPNKDFNLHYKYSKLTSDKTFSLSL
jgi:hypothetical protein